MDNSRTGLGLWPNSEGQGLPPHAKRIFYELKVKYKEDEPRKGSEENNECSNSSDLAVGMTFLGIKETSEAIKNKH